MVKLQPFGDKIVVKVLVPEEKTAGGLLVKPVAKELSNRGLVVAVGEGIALQDGSFRPLSVKVGDEVIFQAGTGLTYKSGQEDYRILASREVLCRFVED